MILRFKLYLLQHVKWVFYISILLEAKIILSENYFGFRCPYKSLVGDSLTRSMRFTHSNNIFFYRRLFLQRRMNQAESNNAAQNPRALKSLHRLEENTGQDLSSKDTGNSCSGSPPCATCRLAMLQYTCSRRRQRSGGVVTYYYQYYPLAPWFLWYCSSILQLSHQIQTKWFALTSVAVIF